MSWILDQMTAKWGKGASWQLDDNNNPHEAGYLKLDCSKASTRLYWQPNWDLEYTLDNIVHWHQVWLSGKNMQNQCLKEISTYQNGTHE